MQSRHGFIKYTVEVFTTDEDRCESRGEREIIVISPEYGYDVSRPVSVVNKQDSLLERVRRSKLFA